MVQRMLCVVPCRTKNTRQVAKMAHPAWVLRGLTARRDRDQSDNFTRLDPYLLMTQATKKGVEKATVRKGGFAALQWNLWKMGLV